MKKLILLAMLAVGMTATAQTTLPAAVKTQFTKQYGKAEIIDSYSENGEWVVEFDPGDASLTARYTPAGKWVETRTNLYEDELPEKVANSVFKAYSDASLDLISLVEKPDQKYYEMDISHDDKYYVLEVSDAGEILKSKEVVNADDEIEDDGDDY